MNKTAHTGGAPGHTHNQSGGQSKTINPMTGRPVTREFRIEQIKSWINQMPWDDIGGNPTKLNPKNPEINDQTREAIERLYDLGQKLGMQSLISGAVKFNQGDLDAAADILFDAKSEVSRVMKSWEKYYQHIGAKVLSFEEKLEVLRNSEYPSYFPLLGPRNVGFYVGGKHGEFGCKPSDKEPGAGRAPGEGACQTPYYNHFVMWGPDCAQCGAAGPDPRYLKLKRKFPHLFTQEQIKARVLGKKRSFFVPSPGMGKYITPPEQGVVYQNMHDPDLLDKEVRSEGLKFTSAEDSDDYWSYMGAFKRFKANEMEKEETVAYMNAYLKRYPYKLKTYEHDHKSPFLDPSKLGPAPTRIAIMSDKEKLLSIAADFEKQSQRRAQYPVDAKKLYSAMVEVFGPNKVPVYFPTMFQDGQKLTPGITVTIKRGNWGQREGPDPKLSATLAQKLGLEKFVVMIHFLTDV